MRPLERCEVSSRRTCRPSLEGLEARDLPANVGALTSALDPALVATLVNRLYAPVVTTTAVTVGGTTFPAGTYPVPQPTASEIQRETFTLRYAGKYTIGPPRFSNQASVVHIYSNGKNAVSPTTTAISAIFFRAIHFPPT